MDFKVNIKYPPAHALLVTFVDKPQLKIIQSWNLNRGLNPKKPGLN